LVLADGHRMHREALVGVLWPGRDAASAGNSLHQALYVARRVLAGAAGNLFCLRDDVVMLSEGGAKPWLDTDAFDAACRRARETGDPDDHQRARELYRGDLVPEDRFEVWADGPRETFRDRHLGLSVDFAELLLRRGEHARVIDLVGSVTAADPFHEGARRMLMRALVATGRRFERWRRSTGSGTRSPRSMPRTRSRPPVGSTATCSPPATIHRARRRRSSGRSPACGPPADGHSPRRSAVCGLRRRPSSVADARSTRSFGRWAGLGC
jgi:hypothetical protein